jgi:epoxyqueuosine reductase
MIKNAALSIGFDACGIAKADELSDDAEFLQSWLQKGNHAEMSYLARNFEKRTDPRKLVPECKSVVVVLLNYYPKQIQNTIAPQIAKFSYSKIDYHLVMKLKLRELERQICDCYGHESVSDNQHVFVDSAPVLERRWAERAGLGWLGKHTQLIHPGLGSYTFIGILMLNIDAEYDVPIRNKCGNCTRCVDACPTQAISNGSLDARKCISYQTIENKNEIPSELHTKLSNCIIGCDICSDVCPWNKKWSKPHSHEELAPISEVLGWDIAKWQNLSKVDFDSAFGNSAIKRAGFQKVKQIIALTKPEKSEINVENLDL